MPGILSVGLIDCQFTIRATAFNRQAPTRQGPFREYDLVRSQYGKVCSMTTANARIGDYVEVRAHPTVVRLEDLDAPDSGWLSESFVLTEEVRNHLNALTGVLAKDAGCGVFLIGHYGAGKSHLLTYLVQHIRAGDLVERAPDVVPISLINFSAENRLEEIIAKTVGIGTQTGDRRPLWDAMLAAHPQGLLLVVDELSEFLRSKPDAQTFTEDVRFLQFIGEWVQDKPCWIIAAMQEGIEHTGELEHTLYRKIKDRYPLRLLLSPAHVKDLIADSILTKKPGYASAVETLCGRLGEAYKGSELDFETLRAVYPLHPATLVLLEEVRDRFSKARGVVDFTVTQLRGDAARGIAPFLDQEWGALLTPDTIVDHFRDLFEVQPEFVPLAQQLFPWYQRHMAELFERPAQRDLAERVLKLLVLAHLSAARDGITAREAATWLSFSAVRTQPERNISIVERVLAALAERGRYVTARGGRYALDLRDDGGAALERLLAREIGALSGQDALVLETVVPLMPRQGFNPFALPRETWQHRRLLWHFHPREYSLWLGEGTPPAVEGVALCLRLPWGDTQPAPGVHSVVPAPIKVDDALVELAALARLQDRPGDPELQKRIQKRLAERLGYLLQVVRGAWQEARIIGPDGSAEAAPAIRAKDAFEGWLESLVLWVLRRRYPGFERFAPGHGPLPKEAWLRFMRYAVEDDLGADQADDFVRLIREAYLVPMGLLRRKGRDYVTPANLDRHELVSLVVPLLEHNPPPQTLHEHLAQPIYGLVPDQVNLLLVFLLLEGEIDILKDRKSYRRCFETLPNPLHYDRVVPAHALGMDQLNALEALCGGLDIRTPAHWSVMTQRRCAQQLVEAGRTHCARLQPLVRQLQELPQGLRVAEGLQEHIDRWAALDKGEHALQGVEQFLFEVGSVSVFLDEVREYQQLPDRIQQLLTETQRLTHLLQQPAVLERASVEDPEFDPEQPPGLHESQQLQEWLQCGKAIYQAYKQDYAQRHQAWWQQIAKHPLWNWRAPPLASSRHLELDEALAAVEHCRSEATRLRCRDLVNLDYQPSCSCGFDGATAPIAASLGLFEQWRDTIDTQLRLFFQQDAVKQRLRDWQRDGLEMETGTVSYLEGKRPVPEVRDIATLDRYLSGVELATDMDIATVVELLGQRLWRPEDLLKELQRRFATSGDQHLRFTGGLGTAIPPQVLAWCAEQCMRNGAPLPQGLDGASLNAITESLRAEWVGTEALQGLEQLGLDEAGVERVLQWLIDGHIALPEALWPDGSVLNAVTALDAGQTPTTPQTLAEHSHALYLAHSRLHRLAGERWLACLDGVACAPMPDLPALVDVLRDHAEAQWLLIDCLGLPLLTPLTPVLHKVFGDWGEGSAQFAQVSETTTTDACYRDLLSAEINHSFSKVNVIDDLIHAGFTPFDELITLAGAQLEVACQRILGRLDRERGLVVFADHGFRIASDGRAYGHGGDSTLERVVPVWCLDRPA